MVQWFTSSQKLVVSRHCAPCIIYIDCEEVDFLIVEGDFVMKPKFLLTYYFFPANYTQKNEGTAITYFTEDGHLSNSVYS